MAAGGHCQFPRFSKFWPLGQCIKMSDQVGLLDTGFIGVEQQAFAVGRNARMRMAGVRGPNGGVQQVSEGSGRFGADFSQAGQIQPCLAGGMDGISAGIPVVRGQGHAVGADGKMIKLRSAAAIFGGSVLPEAGR